MDPTEPDAKPGAIITRIRGQVLREGATAPYDELRATLDAMPSQVRRRPPWLRASILLNVTHRRRASQTRRQLTRLRDRFRAKGRDQDFATFWEQCVKRLAPYSLGPHGYHRSLVSVDSADLWAEVDSLVSRLRDLGLDAFLVSGTLLGVVRDGDFVPHDDDIDLGVVVPGDDTASVATAWLAIRARLAEEGLLDEEFEARGFLHTKARTREGIGVDLFPAWVRDGRAWIWPHTAGDVPIDRLLPLGSREVAGRSLPVPRDAHALLELNYGPAWQVPDPLWSFDWEGAKDRFVDARAAMLAGRPEGGPRRVVVHCGSYKAGSSAIQDWAWQHREALLAEGVLYPLSGLNLEEPDVGVPHSPLAWRHTDDRARWESLVEDLVDEIRGSSAPTVLLSAEAWSRPEHVESLADLLERLRDEDLLGSAEGVLYLRNRLDHARRMYREMTRRRGNVKGFEEWLAGSPASLDVLEVVDRLAPLFDPLHVVPYDEVPDTAAHLSALLGAPYDAPRQRSNPGLGALETEAIRRLQLRAPQLVADWPGLVAALPPELSLDPRDFEEDAAAAAPDTGWSDSFARRTGWDPAQLQAYLDPRDHGLRDVAEVADLLDGVVVSWLRRTAELAASSWTPPHPWVETLVLEPVDPGRDRQPLRGRLTLRPDAPALTLLAISDAGEHPERRRDDGTLRFAIPSVAWGAGSRIDLVAEDPHGHRTVVAHVSRAWRPRS